MNKPEGMATLYCRIGEKRCRFACWPTRTGGEAHLFVEDKLVAHAYAISVEAGLHAVCNYFEGADYHEAINTVDWGFAVDN